MTTKVPRPRLVRDPWLRTIDPSATHLVPAPGPWWLAALARLRLCWTFELRHRRRFNGPVVERIDGVPIVVLPGVFNPSLFRTGVCLARILRVVACGPSTTVLDMGTGSGIGAVFAARRGAQVVAVDINPEAVRCATLNAHVNGLSDRIDVRLGDLFAPVQGKRFDFVLFNPPFYTGAPRTPAEMAWRSDDAFERFMAGLPSVLAGSGRALVILSTDATGPLRTLADARDWRQEVLWQRNYFNERLAVIELRPQQVRSQS